MFSVRWNLTFPVRLCGVFGVLRHAMALGVGHEVPTSEAYVLSQASPCGICGVKSGTGSNVNSSTSVSPCLCHSTDAPYSSLRTRRTTGRSLGTFNAACSVGYRGALD